MKKKKKEKQQQQQQQQKELCQERQEKDKKIQRKSPSVAVELKEDSEAGKVLPRWRLGQLIFE